jgi:ketosteroid isomerase-like protein
MPAHGNPSVVGMSAIKEYWWPASTSKTTITKFVQTLDEVGGDGTLAYARGTSDVEWRTEDKGTAQSWQNGSSFMFLLKRQADGRWLISHLIWDAGANQLLK